MNELENGLLADCSRLTGASGRATCAGARAGSGGVPAGVISSVRRIRLALIAPKLGFATSRAAAA